MCSCNDEVFTNKRSTACPNNVATFSSSNRWHVRKLIFIGLDTADKAVRRIWIDLRKIRIFFTFWKHSKTLEKSILFRILCGDLTNCTFLDHAVFILGTANNWNSTIKRANVEIISMFFVVITTVRLNANTFGICQRRQTFIIGPEFKRVLRENRAEKAAEYKNPRHLSTFRLKRLIGTEWNLRKKNKQAESLLKLWTRFYITTIESIWWVKTWSCKHYLITNDRERRSWWRR